LKIHTPQRKTENARTENNRNNSRGNRTIGRGVKEEREERGGRGRREDKKRRAMPATTTAEALKVQHPQGELAPCETSDIIRTWNPE